MKNKTNLNGNKVNKNKNEIYQHYFAKSLFIITGETTRKYNPMQ